MINSYRVDLFSMVEIFSLNAKNEKDNKVKNEKDNKLIYMWRKLCLSIFGEENLPQNFYEEAIEAGICRDHLALRKMLNPFKWLEFCLLLVSLLGQIPLIILAVLGGFFSEMCRALGEFLDNFVTPKKFNLEKKLERIMDALTQVVLFSIANIFRMVVATVNFATSPINSLFIPLLEYFRHKPLWKSILLVTGALLLASLLIVAIVFSGGGLPAALLFLTPLASILSPVVSATAGVMGAIAAKCVLALTATLFSFGITRNALRTKDVIRHMINEILEYEFYPPKGVDEAINQKLIFDAEGNVKTLEDSNTYSRIFFNTPKDAYTTTSKQQEAQAFLGKVFRFFGSSPESTVPDTEELYALHEDEMKADLASSASSSSSSMFKGSQKSMF